VHSFDCERLSERCALYFGKPRTLRDAVINAQAQTLHSEAYALGTCFAAGLRDIANEVLVNPAARREFFEGIRDHLSD